MPLCPQITNTPITVTQTADFTVSSVLPVVAATTTQLDEVIVLADGKTKAFYQATAPTVGVSEGDIWFDTDDGNKQYYYNGTAWVSVQDTAIAAAQSAATAAQTTADGKNRVYRQTSQPSGGTYAEGDLWFDTDDDNKIYRYTSGSWGTAVTLGNNALASISANKITAGTIDASVITVSNINAGNISTGTLAADRIAAASITGTKIAAGTITASNIATATITATQIAAGTITASNIATGTITATQIAAGTITTDKLVAGTLTGYTVQTSSGSNAVILQGSSNALSFKVSGSVVGNIVPLSSFGVLTHYGATPDPSGGTFPQMFVGSSNVSMFASSTVGLGVSTSLGTTISGNLDVSGVAVFATAAGSAGEFRVLSTGLLRSLFTYNRQVSTSTRPVLQDNAGNFGNSTSTRRNKHQIQSYKINTEALLQLDVKTFKYKPELDEDQTTQYGFIAEEAQELGLNELIQLDKNGIPDYFSYDKLPIFLLQLIKELKAEIDTLKGE